MSRFRIHVAKMAGMLTSVIKKAEKILAQLEQDHGNEKPAIALQQVVNKQASSSQEMQLSFFNLDDPLLEEIKDEILDLDIDTLTPVEALMKLNEIKRLLTKKKKASS